MFALRIGNRAVTAVMTVWGLGVPTLTHCADGGAAGARRSAGPEAVPDWVYTARIAGQRFPKSVIEDRGAAGAYARHLKEHYVNTLFVAGGVHLAAEEEHGGHLRCKTILNLDTPHNVGLMKPLVDACHKEAIRVVLHLESLFWNGDPRKGWGSWDIKPEDRPPWPKQIADLEECSQMDARRGYVTSSKDKWHFCPNNPRIRAAHVSGALYRFAKATDMDGFFSDWLFWGVGGREFTTACACGYCRAKFTAETGYTLPKDPESPFWGNYKEPGWRAFVRWRSRTMADFMVDVRRALKSIKPDNIVTAYTTLPTYSTSMIAGGDYGQWVRGCDLLGYERNTSPFYNWRTLSHEFKYLYALGVSHGRAPAWTTVYGDPGERYFLMALNALHGLRNWEPQNRHGLVYIKDIPAKEGIAKKFFGFEAAHEELFKKPLPFGNIGLVYSSQTRSSYRGLEFYKGTHNRYRAWRGWAAVLTEANLPYNIITDRQLARGELDPIDCLILSNTACLSETQVHRISEFVESGGTLIATYETSLFDQTGEQLKDFSLGGLLKVRYERSVEGPAEMRIAPPRDDAAKDIVTGLPSRMRHGAAFVQVTRLEGAELIASFEHKGKAYPAITVASHGKGKSVYIAGRPGLMVVWPDVPPVRSFRRRVKPLKTWQWTDGRVPEYSRLIRNSARFGVCQRPAVETVNFPSGVLANAFRMENEAFHGHAVHLLNACGSRLESDAILDLSSYNATYPDLKTMSNGKAMKLRLRIPRPSVAYVVSPDFPSRKLLDIMLLPNGYCQVDIPFFRRYAVIALKAEL